MGLFRVFADQVTYVSSRVKMFLIDIATHSVEEAADVWYNNDGEVGDKTELS